MSEHLHRVTWPDIFAGRAEIEIGPDARVRLAKLAGAPWNDSDPEAELSPLQVEVVTAPERVLVLFGGSRGGKSISGGCIALAELMIPNARIALIGAIYEHCAKEFGYLWKGFFKLFPRSAATEAQFVQRAPHFNMRLTTVWGATVGVYSILAKEGAQILGSEFDLAILCEAAQVPHEVYSNKIERALLGRAKRRQSDGYLRRTGRAILLTTPKQQSGASYDVYHRAIQRTRGDLSRLHLDRGATWFDSMRFWQADVRELNPSYPIEAFEAARRTLPRHAFEEQFLGKAVMRSGLVYSSFGEKTLIERDKLPSLDVLRRAHWGIGIDTGSEYAAILACITQEPESGRPRAYVVGEARLSGGNTQEKAKETLDMIRQALGDVFPDPKGAVEFWCVDVASQNVEDLETHLDVSLYRQKYDLVDSIGHLDTKMGNGEIFVIEDLQFLVNEFRGYRWRRAKTEGGQVRDRPVGEDHALDAMRYLLMQLFEHGPPAPEAIPWTVDDLMAKAREELLTPNLQRDLEKWRQRGSILESRW